MAKGHVVLLGDSIFDNAAYVGGAPDVVRQLRERLPEDWRASLCAVDGAVIRSVERQLRETPEEASHLVLSVGGNDALGYAGILREGARSVAEVLDRLSDIAERFEAEYHQMLDAVLRRALPTGVCTVYYPNFPDADAQRLSVAALSLFNDAIIRAAFTRGLPLIDLRLVCNDAADYANPIEPSAHGGAKIASAIARLVTEHNFARRRTEVFI
ncbi:MAG TPA: SGNH/GDSL hydrolase family protein [Pyrinomonadaceae bacterium]|nr:SGNH/GDSL hydrolase family protein [Pyrinomonadaceae bacterium]